MGFSIAEMLSGNIVQPRPVAQDNSSAGLGQMLSFLMNSNQQPVAQVAKPEMPSLSELAAISAGRRKEKQQADATEQMRQLIGTPEIIERNSADPLSNQNIVTQRGTGVSGGQGNINDVLFQMMKSSEPGTVQQALSTYSNLNQPRSANRDGVRAGWNMNPDGSVSPMAVTNAGPGIKNTWDAEVALANAKGAAPGFGEQAKLDIARDANVRQTQSESRNAERENRAIEKLDRQTTLQEWNNDNPNYKKNMADIQNAENEYEKLKNGIYAYAGSPVNDKGVSDSPGIIDRYDQTARHNPLKNGELQTEYQSVTWPLRGESMINTGVLNPGDMKSLNAAIQDPTDWSVKGFRDNTDIKKQAHEILTIGARNLAAMKKIKMPTSPPPFSQQSYQPAPSNAPLSAADYIKTHGGRQ
jgi:hypothetical protein